MQSSVKLWHVMDPPAASFCLHTLAAPTTGTSHHQRDRWCVLLCANLARNSANQPVQHRSHQFRLSCRLQPKRALSLDPYEPLASLPQTTNERKRENDLRILLGKL